MVVASSSAAVAVLVTFLLCAVSGSIASRYVVTVKRLNGGRPIVSSQHGHGSGEGGSTFLYNYNTAFVPLPDQKPGKMGALLVRCQNLSQGAQDPYSVGPSKIAFASIRTPLAEVAKGTRVEVDFISSQSVVIEPEERNNDMFGTEDPRVAFDERTGEYYTLFSAVENTTAGKAISRLALSTTKEPSRASTYDYHGPLFPKVKWSKSGALLIRSQGSVIDFVRPSDQLLSDTLLSSFVLVLVPPFPCVLIYSVHVFVGGFDTTLVPQGRFLLSARPPHRHFHKFGRFYRDERSHFLAHTKQFVR
jgi:hypothetical protein